MHLVLPRNRSMALDRPRLVGVLNVTPDSFSDGGKYRSQDEAVIAGLAMVEAGADVIDIGGESTRPGADRIDAGEQRRRVLPVIEQLRQRCEAAISIDTTRRDVAAAALDAGADIVNDVSAGREDARMFALLAERGVPVVLMHMRGEPTTMQHDPRYEHVVAEVKRFLADRAAAAEEAGVAREQIVIDPGIGFGKTTDHNLALLAHLDQFVATGRPVLVGASRKRFLGRIAGEEEPTRREPGTAAVTALAVWAGVQMLRVHDAASNRQAADIAAAVRDAK